MCQGCAVVFSMLKSEIHRQTQYLIALSTVSFKIASLPSAMRQQNVAATFINCSVNRIVSFQTGLVIKQIQFYEIQQIVVM
jgi:hypothetical protein